MDKDKYKRAASSQTANAKKKLHNANIITKTTHANTITNTLTNSNTKGQQVARRQMQQKTTHWEYKYTDKDKNK